MTRKVRGLVNVNEKRRDQEKEELHSRQLLHALPIARRVGVTIETDGPFFKVRGEGIVIFFSWFDRLIAWLRKKEKEMQA